MGEENANWRSWFRQHGPFLGLAFNELGHEVRFGAGRQEQARAAAELADARAYWGSNSEAAAFGEVVIWTVRDVPAGEVVSDVGLLAGKPIIDMSNLSVRTESRARVNSSMAEQLQSELRNAQVVKAFNTFAIELFELAPSPLDQHHVSVFLASDHEPAKAVIAGLARSLAVCLSTAASWLMRVSWKGSATWFASSYAKGIR